MICLQFWDIWTTARERRGEFVRMNCISAGDVGDWDRLVEILKSGRGQQCPEVLTSSEDLDLCVRKTV